MNLSLNSTDSNPRRGETLIEVSRTPLSRPHSPVAALNSIERTAGTEARDVDKGRGAQKGEWVVNIFRGAMGSERRIHCVGRPIKRSTSAGTIRFSESVFVTCRVPKEGTGIDWERGQEVRRFVKDNCVTVHFAAITSFQCRLLPAVLPLTDRVSKLSLAYFATRKIYSDLRTNALATRPTPASSCTHRHKATVPIHLRVPSFPKPLPVNETRAMARVVDILRSGKLRAAASRSSFVSELTVLRSIGRPVCERLSVNACRQIPFAWRADRNDSRSRVYRSYRFVS